MVMALTHILNINGLCLFPSRFPTYAGIFTLSRLDFNLINLICVSGKKTVAKELGLPEPPKKPILPFMKFLYQELETNSDLKRQDRVAFLGQKWNSLNRSLKAKYIDEHYIEAKEYTAKYNAYINNLTPDQLFQMRELNNKRQKKKLVNQKIYHEGLEKNSKKRKHRKECKELGKPEPPGSTFNFYLKSIAGETPTGGEGTFMDFAAEKWKALPEEAKEPYKKMAKERREVYQKELTKWEKKMIAIGRVDLLDS